ncbi:MULTISPECIES: RNA-directed DNA polymerase [unclassified Photobacterium]|uniref:RNA-directed DNA polymerase n=1 Tax=unclassified Photobacterium TaxID=2628852 RepID=UPI001EDD17E3|nr:MULTISPECIES: RNA-directed DNA polymerase [unclassified Photobacterium]MCG3862637.1 RNA-directed DNA polymerase [Photobacterium sp. Ph6]MCG3874168.1 RNA-directed DNA polymerase [Photobacterium sp. Ph5]
MHIKPYANRINLKCKFNDDTKPDEDGSFYIPYFNQYQKWRDNSISEAKKLLSNNKDVLIFSLDIKNYYNSARINLSNLNSDIGFSDLKYEPIRKIFIEIHKKYTSHLNKKLDLNIEDGISIIPIGLVSSGILSNFYLNELDKDIDLKLNPDFYARYVDDIMIVKSCHKK